MDFFVCVDISSKSQVKYLCVTIDNDKSDPTMGNSVKKINSRTKCLYRKGVFLCLKEKSMWCSALIQSRLC